jgi:PIN domain nuclease of toxin-antitoxin system
MRLLLDTHSFLWFVAGDDQLSEAGRKLISDAENEVLLSVASLWEIVIKASLGKLELAGSFDDTLLPQLKSNDIQVLGIEMAHLGALGRLPQHHRDPFDRLIIAQAVAEGVPLVGRDQEFKKYDVQLLW